MTHEDDLAGPEPPPARAPVHSRVRPPTLGRMSVFVIGLAIGAAVGASAGVWGLEMVQDLAAAGAPVSRAMLAVSRPAPPALVPQAAPAPPAPTQALAIVPGRPLVIGVFGDSMADGLWAGLYRDLHGDGAYRVVRFSQASTGLARFQYVDVQQRTAEQLAGQPVDVAVVLFGANDAQDMLSGGEVLPFGSPGWRQVYTARIDALVGLLRRQGGAVYWVGLPRMRRAAYDERAALLNQLYQERAAAAGVPFVATVPVTIDADGRYEDYLPDPVSHRPRLMRAKDGIHMTMAGYQRLAGPVSGLIRSDVARTLAAAAPGPGRGPSPGDAFAPVSTLASAPPPEGAVSR